MDILPNSSQLRDIRTDAVAEYLRLTGWKPTESPSRRWLTFQGVADREGHPLEIVLPSDPSASDAKVHLVVAVHLLAEIREEPIDAVIARIRYHDRDVLRVRDLETAEQDSITLELAARQVYCLKQFVAFAASSERDPKPKFNVALDIGRDLVRRYRFGHTFAGSFGLTVEAPIRGEPVVMRQLSLAPEEADDIVVMPIERRVMERIARGLRATHDARQYGNIDLLVREYPSAFNANMCRALAEMSFDKNLPIRSTR